jgi:hypothetical protein
LASDEPKIVSYYEVRNNKGERKLATTKKGEAEDWVKENSLTVKLEGEPSFTIAEVRGVAVETPDEAASSSEEKSSSK